MDNRPQRTLADYLIVAISPVLIMVLVGSLVFFLIQVFYRGELVHAIRWVMFWFVLAVVLISRVGIEQGSGYGRIYAAALAVTMWLYLAHTHNLPFLGALLLALTWWCAHVLTVDCTLISEDEDSGEGVLQGVWRHLEETLAPPAPTLNRPPLTPLEIRVVENLAARRAQKPARPPGRSLVYFSLAALPLFGFGQLFLPADDPHARRVGFAFLAVYLSAALCLLASTSFLGLRRYLRKRSVEIPATVTLGWIKFAALLAGGVLLLAMILPRPGATRTWKELVYRTERKEQHASHYALPFNPPGDGEGTPTDQPVERNLPGVQSSKPSSGTAAQNDRPTQSDARSQSDQASPSEGGFGRNGSQGSFGREGQSGGEPQSAGDDRAPEKKSLRLRDMFPSGRDEPSDEKNQPAAPGDIGEHKGDGAGAGVDGSGKGQPSRPSAASPNKPPKPPKPPPVVQKPSEPEPQQIEKPADVPKPTSEFLRKFLRVLGIAALVALLIWALVRYRKVIADMTRSFIAAVSEFFRRLFSFRRRKPAPAAPPPVSTTVLQPFATYENPFLTGKDRHWPPERLLFYTYEVLQAWAKEQGIRIKPYQTPREFCCELMEHFPDMGPDMERFSFYYAHAAFARRLPDDFETDSLRRLWQYLGDSITAVSG